MLNKSILLILFTALSAQIFSVPAFAMRDEQSKAREQFNSGKVMKLREIEARIIPRMRGMEYLGPEYDAEAKVYRLKFIKEGRVIFVDVDARTGAILAQR
jgi:uncharacterized membrane protein YkoI